MSPEDSVNGRFSSPENCLLAYFLFRWGLLGGVRVRMYGYLDVWWHTAAGLGLLLMGGSESVTPTLSSSVVERVCLLDILNDNCIDLAAGPPKPRKVLYLF